MPLPLAPPAGPDALARHAAGLRRLARRLVGDADAADDVVQDAYVAALRRGPAPGVPAGPWLVRVVRNLSARWRRSRAREDARLRRLATRAESPRADEALGVLDRARVHRRLMRVLLSLEEPYRSTLLLRFFDGCSPRTIAARTGVPSATVRTHIHRGLRAMRERLDAEERERGGRRAWSLALISLADGPPRGVVVPIAGGVAVASKAWLAGAAGLVVLLGAGAVFISTSRDDARTPSDAAPRVLEPAPETLAAKPTDGKPALGDAKPVASPATADGVTGVVRDESGRPVPGATVRTLRVPFERPRDDDGAPVELALDTTKSGADGSFSLPLAKGDVVRVRASAAGHATTTVDEARAGERLSIALGPGVPFTVRAVDERKSAVAAVRVRLFAPRHWASPTPGVEASGTTGADGRVVFDGLPKGSWTMIAATHDTLGSPMWQRVELPPVGRDEFTIVMPTGRTITGRVTNLEGGDPIAGARVGLGWTLFRAVKTDASGEYTLPGYTGEGYFDVYGEAPGFSSAKELVGARSRVDIALAPGASIVGRVVAKDRSPIAGARLKLTVDAPAETWRYVTSRADGAFEVPGAPRGSVSTLEVAAEGFGRTLLDVSVLDIDRVDVNDVVLAPGHAIEGVVVGVDSKPVDDVTVMASGENTDRGRLLPAGLTPSDPRGVDRRVQTDRGGRFAFRDLSPGAYEVKAMARGRREVARRVELTDREDVRDLEFRLAGSHRLLVRVHDRKGTPISGAAVEASCADPYSVSAYTDGRGEAVVYDDAPFQWVEATVYLTNDAWIPPPRRRLVAGEDAVDLVFEPATLAHGTVIDVSGKPAGRNLPLAVTLVGEPIVQQTPFSKNQVFSDDEGRFRVIVPVGAKVDVEALPSVLDDGTAIGGRLEGVEGGAKGLELRLRPLVRDRSLRVLVLAPDGTPAPDVQVYARIAGRDIAGANRRTGADGRARFDGLPESGAYVFATPLAESAGAGRWTKQAVPVPRSGDEITVRFKIARVVRGVVVESDGTPAKGAYVTAFRDGDRDSPVTADAEGRFVLTLEADDTSGIRVGAATMTGLSSWVELPKDDSPLVLKIAPRK